MQVPSVNSFDPLQTRNAYFNICRLGVVVRRYLLDVYGSTSSPLHGGLPTDRLVAEWHLASDRVEKLLTGKEPAIGEAKERVELVLDESSPETIAQTQIQVRQRFQDLFARGYVVTWFEKLPGRGAYLLEPESRAMPAD